MFVAYDPGIEIWSPAKLWLVLTMVASVSFVIGLGVGIDLL